jgi:hypothetical protein
MFPKKKYHNPYYWTCPYCGANLDPGESCDCPDSIVDTDYSDVKPTICKKDQEEEEDERAPVDDR